MAALNKTQLAYAKEKISLAATERMARFKASLGPAPKRFQYTDAEKTEFIRKGKATLKEQFEAGNYAVLGSCFSYPETPVMKTANAKADAYNAKVEAEQKKINAIKTQVLDELVMSPDGMDALNKIAAAFA